MTDGEEKNHAQRILTVDEIVEITVAINSFTNVINQAYNIINTLSTTSINPEIDGNVDRWLIDYYHAQQQLKKTFSPDKINTH